MIPDSSEAVRTAVAPVASMLKADGYTLEVARADSEGLILRIEAGPDACAECLVPSSMMELYVRHALVNLPQWSNAPIELIYP